MNEDVVTTPRGRAKADRREALLSAAARLFAENGFARVSLEDLGAAVGISGPAVYRHFDSKQAVLAALLVGVSEDLVAGGLSVVEDAADDGAALRALIRFHVQFALANPDVIRVQDRDLASLADDDQHAVRTLQREYVELWVAVLGRVHPDTDTESLRIRAHATFGLINSTPHSARARDLDATRGILEQMAAAGLS
ncbi:SACE_7040 family transcriptional regulator [Parafrigoribacterium soli]|uniref:SACE_7040 family transcriptional regulator n=1 Tax=Parafrigoribacterium soli TaxID=3144663 RepID=UPI0032EBD389